MNKSMLQCQMILMPMLLMLTCFSQSAGGTLTCDYFSSDYGKQTFTVMTVEHYKDEVAVAPNVAIDVSTNITCYNNEPSTAREWFFKIECPVGWQFLLRRPDWSVDEGIDVLIYDDDDGDYDDYETLDSTELGPLSIFLTNNLLGIAIHHTADTADVMLGFALNIRIAKVIERLNDSDLPGSECTLENMMNTGRDSSTMELLCNTQESSYENVLVSFAYDFPEEIGDGYVTIVCREVDGQDNNIVPRIRSARLSISCTRMSEALSIRFITRGNLMNIEIYVYDIIIETVVWGPDSLVSSNSGGDIGTYIAVSSVIVTVILAATLIAVIWCKRRIKPVSNTSNEIEGHNSLVNGRHHDEPSGEVDTNANPRYVSSGTAEDGGRGVCNPSNHGNHVTYNEIGEQDYNVLFGGMERGDYHEYNVPDNPQDRPTDDRTTSNGSGPYQELVKNRLDVSVDAERSQGTTGMKQKLPDEHAYQDLRKDERNLDRVQPDDEYAHQQARKEIPSVTEKEYQALEKDTPEYATLEPSNDYTALGQRDSNQSMKGGTDCSRIVVETPLEDGKYEEQKVKDGATSDNEDPIKDLPGEPYDHIQRANLSDTSAASHPTISGPQSYNDDDDYQTPVNVADEDPRNTYQTLDKPELQDTAAEEYSHLRRSPRTNHSPNSTDNNTQYGKLNGTA